MPKVQKRIKQNENHCKDLHVAMNMRIGPTRLEPWKNVPLYVIPDVDPLQRQVNRLEERANRNERLCRRRAWRNGL